MWTWLQQFPWRQSSHKRPELWGLQLWEPSPQPGQQYVELGAGTRAQLSGRQAWMSELGNGIILISSAWGKRTLCTGVFLCVCVYNRLHFCQGNTHSCQRLLTEQALTALLGTDKREQEESWHSSPQRGTFMNNIILISSCFCQKQGKKP